MTMVPVNRRTFIKSSTAITAGLVLSPAIIGRAEAATMKLKCSSSLPNDPKYANGRVYYDNLVKNLKANGLGEQVEVAFFPDNQLGQEIDVINSVKLGVIDLMVSGSSISANLVPLVGTYDLGFLFSSFPQQTKAFDAGAVKPIAVSSRQRLKEFPDLPTLKELGYDELTAVSWFGLSGPAGLPDEITQRLNAAVAQMVERPDVRALLDSDAIETQTMTPGEFTQFVADEIAKWGPVAKRVAAAH